MTDDKVPSVLAALRAAEVALEDCFVLMEQIDVRLQELLENVRQS